MKIFVEKREIVAAIYEYVLLDIFLPCAVLYVYIHFYSYNDNNKMSHRIYARHFKLVMGKSRDATLVIINNES